MRKMAFVLLIGCSTVSSASPNRVDTATTDVLSTGHTIFYDRSSSPYHDLPIDLPTAAAVHVPKIDGVFAMANIRCRAIERDRSLTDCGISVEPTGRGYERAVRATLSKLRVSRDFRRDPQAKIRFIDIQLKMWNSSTLIIDGPCWPPSCVPVPPPPPPPSVEPAVR